MSVLLKRRTILAAKIETTPGTAIAVTTTDGGFNAYDISYEADIPMSQRQSEGSLSMLPALPGARMAKIKFKIDGYGSGAAGTAPAWANVFLPACGFLVPVAGVFALTSDVTLMSTLTMEVFEDGLMKKAVGCMGTVDISGSNGKPLTFSFEFTGAYVAPSDVALLGITRSLRIPPVLESATLSIGAYVPLVSKVDLKSGNVVTMREDVTQTSGYINALVTGRNWTGSLDPEATKVGTYDAYGTWLAGTTAALTLTVGSSGSGLTIAAPASQYSGIKEGDRGGKLLHDLEFACVQSGATADSEVTITF
jgi:hypothetical protein